MKANFFPNLDISEFYGLNPNVYWCLEERVTVELPKELNTPSNKFKQNLFYFLMVLINLPYLPEVSVEKAKRDQHKLAREYAIEKSHQDLPIYSISELKNISQDELKTILKETAGHIRVRGIPSPHKITTLKPFSFLTGGLFPRLVNVESDLSFYIKDENDSKLYCGLDESLSQAMLHVIAAGDEKQEIQIGIQLPKEYNLTVDQYLIDFIGFPSENICSQDPYLMIADEKLKEIADPSFKDFKKGIFSQKDKNRLFRAILELGYMY